MQAQDAVVAIETLDCARRVRIYYLLPIPAGRELVQRITELFPDALVELREFSKQVTGASDHFSVSAGLEFRAAGVLGERRVVVTYGKSAGGRPTQVIATFERLLESSGYGRIERRARTKSQGSPDT